MPLRDLMLAAAIVALLPSCQQEAGTAKQIERIQQARDPRQAVRQPVTCTDTSDACGRLYEEHGGACLDLTEAADQQTRADMRRCAVTDFRQALAHLPQSSDRLIATRGLAEAVRISRDNGGDTAGSNEELVSLAQQLQPMQGGAPFGAYYASNVDLNRTLTRSVASGAACPTLKTALLRLPAGNIPDDLKKRMDELRLQLSTAMQNRSCA